MRFSVRARTQNALFRRVRFSSPAQTWSHLTQRRILRRRSHVKAQSAPAASRKDAFCVWASPKGALCMRAGVAPRAHFRRSAYTAAYPRPLARPGGATGPTTSTAPWPRDVRELGPEAHAAGTVTQLPIHTSSRSLIFDSDMHDGDESKPARWDPTNGRYVESNPLW